VLAAILLLLFQFSITPKLLLHDLVADHQDTPLSANNEKNPQFHLAGFNCACENQVVESPFIEDSILTENFIPVIVSDRFSSSVGGFVSAPFLYLGLRGPPAPRG